MEFNRIEGCLRGDQYDVMVLICEVGLLTVRLTLLSVSRRKIRVLSILMYGGVFIFVSRGMGYGCVTRRFHYHYDSLAQEGRGFDYMYGGESFLTCW